jgi:FAD binding domain
MAGLELMNSKGEVVSENRIEEFRLAFRGKVIRPGDAAYDPARRIWNASVDKRPGIIARCSGAVDVVNAVNFARENELLVAVRGGGHNVGGRALCDGGIVVDLSCMRGIHIDARNRTALVQAGATLSDVDRETHIYGWLCRRASSPQPALPGSPWAVASAGWCGSTASPATTSCRATS